MTSRRLTTMGVLGCVFVGTFYSVGLGTLVPEDSPDWAFSLWLCTPLVVGVMAATWALISDAPVSAVYPMALMAIAAWGVGYALGVVVMEGTQAVGGGIGGGVVLSLFAALTASLVITLVQTVRRRWGQHDHA